jgi:hypothetical protein
MGNTFWNRSSPPIKLLQAYLDCGNVRECYSIRGCCSISQSWPQLDKRRRAARGFSICSKESKPRWLTVAERAFLAGRHSAHGFRSCAVGDLLPLSPASGWNENRPLPRSGCRPGSLRGRRRPHHTTIPSKA